MSNYRQIFKVTALLGGTQVLVTLVSIVLTAALCLSGIWYFRKMERTFADVI